MADLLEQLSMPLPLALVILFLFTFIGNGVLPVPVTPYVLWMGHYHVPVLVVAVGMLGNVLGWTVAYRYLAKFLDKKPSLEARIPVYYKKLFMSRMGFFIFLFNALPFPFDPMRILASVGGYSGNRLLLFIVLGRAVRYTMLVTLGAVLAKYKIIFWLLIAFFLVLPILFKTVLKNMWSDSSRSPKHIDVLEEKA